MAGWVGVSAPASDVVQDLGSASGTFVDDARLPANKPQALAEGAVLTLGECKTTYTYRLAQGKSGKRKR